MTVPSKVVLVNMNISFISKMSSSKQKNVPPIGLKREKKRKIRRLKINCIILYWEKFSHNITLEVPVVWKIYGKSIEMLKDSWISENFN